MKPIAVFVLAAALSVAGLSLASGAAMAKTVTSSQGNADQKSVAGVAGPATAAENSNPDHKVAQTDTKQPSKKVLKKTEIKPPPPLHDPN